MLQVIIDPNVFVSAVITPDGVPAQIVHAALVREFHLVVSPALIGELVDVLARPKLRPYIDGEQAVSGTSIIATLGCVPRHVADALPMSFQPGLWAPGITDPPF